MGELFCGSSGHYEKGEIKMEWISKPELRKLAFMCQRRATEASHVLSAPSASDMEKALANHEREYMLSLSAKLERIATSDKRRVEITI